MSSFVVSFINKQTGALVGSHAVEAATPIEAVRFTFAGHGKKFNVNLETISEAVVFNKETQTLVGVGRYGTEWYERT